MDEINAGELVGYRDNSEMIRSAASRLGVDLSNIDVANLLPYGAAGFNIPGTDIIYLDYQILLYASQNVVAEILTHEVIHSGQWENLVKQYVPNLPSGVNLKVYSEAFTELFARKIAMKFYRMSQNEFWAYNDVIADDNLFDTFWQLDLPELIQTVFNTEGVPARELSNNNEWMVNNVAYAYIDTTLEGMNISNLSPERYNSLLSEAWKYSRKSFGRELSDMEVYEPGAMAGNEGYDTFERGIYTRFLYGLEQRPDRQMEMFSKLYPEGEVIGKNNKFENVNNFVEQMHAVGLGHMMLTDEGRDRIYKMYEQYYDKYSVDDTQIIEFELPKLNLAA